MKDKKEELKQAAAIAAAQAADTSREIFEEALAKTNVLLAEAQKTAIPMAKRARAKTADFAAARLDEWEPHIRKALAGVTPAVEAARDRITDEALPGLQTFLHQAADHPVAQETKKRSKAAVQALKGDLEPAKPKRHLCRNVGKTLGQVLLVGGVVAAIVAAVRYFLMPKDDGWTAHEPSKTFVPPTPAAPTAKPAAPAAEASAPKDQAARAETPVAEEKEAAAAATDSDSFVGPNPPEGFIIKGNERSMKYHVPGTGGYERTIAEIWFRTEEAAVAAGFTKAQR